eukprot:s577_g9.t1
MEQIPEEPVDHDQQASEQEYQDAEEYAEDGEQGHDGDDQQDAGHADDDDDDAAQLQELADVLTVTSKKLQSTVLGRKFTGRPRTIEERKRTSTCTACGQLGHWAGDSVCTMSNKDKDKSSKGAGKHGKDGQGKSVKKAFVVNVPGEPSHEQHQLPDAMGTSTSTLGNPSTFFTFMGTHKVEHDPFTNYITEIINFAGYMIVDTACQRSCCSSKWFDIHTKIMMNHGFRPHVIDVTDHFQFGSGGIHKAAKRAYLPAALPGQPAEGLLLGVSVLKDAQIPFLASNTMLEKLGCVIDTVRQRLRFEFIGVDVPLERLHGHYVVNIASFSKLACKSDVWKHLSEDGVWDQPDPEVVLAATCAQAPERPSHPDVLHQRATGMASALEGPGEAIAHLVPEDTQEYEPNGGTRDGTSGLAHDVGAAHHCHGGQRDESFKGKDTSSFVFAPGVPPLRQQGRKVQPVPSMPPEVQVQRRASRIAKGSTSKAKATPKTSASARVREIPIWEQHGLTEEEYQDAMMNAPTPYDSDDPDAAFREEFDWRDIA